MTMYEISVKYLYFCLKNKRSYNTISYDRQSHENLIKSTIPVLTELDFDAHYILDVFIIPVFDKYVFGFFEFCV